MKGNTSFRYLRKIVQHRFERGGLIERSHLAISNWTWSAITFVKLRIEDPISVIIYSLGIFLGIIAKFNPLTRISSLLSDGDLEDRLIMILDFGIGQELGEMV
ncbi:hypothetical protein Trydic_g20673 [Trypoxylus dichotomus]